MYVCFKSHANFARYTHASVIAQCYSRWPDFYLREKEAESGGDSIKHLFQLECSLSGIEYIQGDHSMQDHSWCHVV